MKKIAVLIFTISTLSSYGQNKNLSDFSIADSNKVTSIYIDKNTDPLIIWAVNELADDVKDITGKRPEIIQTNTISKKGIYIGQFSSSLFKSTSIEKELLNQWEKFSIQKEKDNLLIAGSDVRGTVYAIFEITERLGVSPWKWWADVHSIKKENLALQLPRKGIITSPSVQYRGIF